MRRVAVLIFALAACSPATLEAAVAPTTDAHVRLDWATHLSQRLGGDELLLQGRAGGAFPDAVRVVDADGAAIAEASTSRAVAGGDECLRYEPGSPVAILPLTADVAVALRAGRFEARVAGRWLPVTLADRGCRSID